MPNILPKEPPKKARLKRVDSEILHLPDIDFLLSIPKTVKASKFMINRKTNIKVFVL